MNLCPLFREVRDGATRKWLILWGGKEGRKIRNSVDSQGQVKSKAVIKAKRKVRLPLAELASLSVLLTELADNLSYSVPSVWHYLGGDQRLTMSRLISRELGRAEIVPLGELQTVPWTLCSHGPPSEHVSMGFLQEPSNNEGLGCPNPVIPLSNNVMTSGKYVFPQHLILGELPSWVWNSRIHLLL